MGEQESNSHTTKARQRVGSEVHVNNWGDLGTKLDETEM
jgi:hypothetical protein